MRTEIAELKEFKDVVHVCENLDIPYYSIDFVRVSMYFKIF